MRLHDQSRLKQVRGLIAADRRSRRHRRDPVQRWLEQQRREVEPGTYSEPVLICALCAAAEYCTAPAGIGDDFEFWLRRAARRAAQGTLRPQPVVVAIARLMNQWVSLLNTLNETGHRRLLADLIGLLSAFSSELERYGPRTLKLPEAEPTIEESAAKVGGPKLRPKQPRGPARRAKSASRR
ncbi:MAG: hypothetical protein IPK26_23865 [Planctomycetes bacterium]|nr:hypothetical protein [Planctomycetota bacterium]